LGIFKILYRIKILSPKGLYYLLTGIFNEGKTLNALLFYCAKMFSNNKALVYEKEHISYKEFYNKSLNLASNLNSIYKIKQKNRVAVFTLNTSSSIITLFALSRTGVHIYLLNPEMSEEQFLDVNEKKKFNFIIYQNEELKLKFKTPSHVQSIIITGNKTNSISTLIKQKSVTKITRRKGGNITILTGGTTGNFKSVSRKQSIFNFLNPLVVIIDEMQLFKFKKVYIPTPIYHGYGLASLIISVLLGSEIYITNGFNTKNGNDLIKSNKIEVITLVPIMLIRMLNENSKALISLKRILSGGAPLNPGIITNTNEKLNTELYNLYGTTEAGFCILGTPEILKKYPNALGKAIKGVKIRVLTDKNIGQLEVKSNWTMKSKNSKWIKTGDLVNINKSNVIFLKGRNDSMIVSGGENVYPEDLKNILSTHPKIKAVAVIGIVDIDFGKRLKAIVSLKTNEKLSEPELKDWLKNKIARYQMPVSIQFVKKLPISEIGKIKKTLLP